MLLESDKKKDKIIFYCEKGISQAKILKILKVSRCTVQEVIKKKIKTGKRLIGNGFIFQQNNDPKHNALKVKLFREGTIWGCSSDEMASSKSRFEYHWVFVELLGPKKGQKEHLWLVFQDAWNNIVMDYINEIKLSIPKRIKAVFTTKSWHTEY